MELEDRDRHDPASGTTCASCGRSVDSGDHDVVSVVIGRAEVLDWDDERVFRQEQVHVFCDLTHADEHLRSHGIEDEWNDVELAEATEPVVLAGCLLVALALLGVLVVGTVVTLRWAWGLMT